MTQQIDFTDQAVIVTGAGRGLGRLYALEIARRGGAVVVNDPGGSMGGDGADARVADEVVAEIREAGGVAVASYDSVATAEGGEAIVRTAVQRFGRLDAVISNAGIFSTVHFEDLTVEQWRRMLNVHLDGGFFVSQPAFRVMKAQGYGRFVFISSSGGLFGMPQAAHYAAAKAGLFGLTNVLALEGAPHGILANTVLPTGYTRMASQTELDGDKPPERTGFHQAIDPELVVPLAVFLASRACDVSHHNFASCAGRYARVFVGYAEGWLSEAGSRPDAEDIQAHLAQIAATDRFSIPGSIFDEVREICVRRAIRG
jgi:NAD(P)-dependent dehydrogenase (short-subunit alcohol dehydrogenase family)